MHEILWESSVAQNLHYLPVHRQPRCDILHLMEAGFDNTRQLYLEVITLLIWVAFTKPDKGYQITLLGKKYISRER